MPLKHWQAWGTEAVPGGRRCPQCRNMHSHIGIWKLCRLRSPDGRHRCPRRNWLACRACRCGPGVLPDLQTTSPTGRASVSPGGAAAPHPRAPTTAGSIPSSPLLPFKSTEVTLGAAVPPLLLATKGWISSRARLLPIQLQAGCQHP